MKYYRIGCLLAAILFLSSCQPTPEQDVVVGKNEGVLESIVEATHPPEENGSTESEAFHYTDQLAGADPMVRIQVDAEVSPGNGPMPVVRVKPYAFTIEEVQNWARVFFEGNTVYEYDGRLTKQELEEMILEYRQALGDEEYIQQEGRGDPEEMEWVRERLEREIALCEEQYDSAPDGSERRETDWTFKGYLDYEPFAYAVEDDSRYEGTQRIKLTAEVDGYTATLDVKNRTQEDYQLHTLEFALENAYQQTPLEESPVDAELLAHPQLEEVGLGNWRLDSCEPVFIESFPNTRTYATDRYYYALTYVPVYEGAEVIAQDQLSGSEGMEAYTSRYHYETLTVHVSNGRIVYLRWEAPLQATEVEDPNVQTMSFEEAMGRFEEQMAVQATAGNLYQAEEGYEPEAIEIRIEEIELGLARVRIQDNQAEYYLLPVWNFKGQLGVDTGQGMAYDSDYVEAYSPYTFLTINALDGSIVDVSQGY